MKSPATQCQGDTVEVIGTRNADWLKPMKYVHITTQHS